MRLINWVIIPALLLNVMTSVAFAANDPRYSELSLDNAIQLASTIKQLESKKAEIDSAIALLKKSTNDVVNELENNQIARKHVRTFIESFVDRLIDQAKSTNAFKTFYDLQNDIKTIQQRIDRLKARLASGRQEYEDLRQEIEEAKALVESYQLLLNADSKAVLNFANGKLARSLKEPIEFKLGSETVTLQVVEGTEKILSGTANITVKVQYGGGVSAKLKGITVNLTNPQKPQLSFPNPPQIEIDQSSIKSAATELLGQAVSKLDLPFPVSIEKDVKPSGTIAGIPKLSAIVSIKVPGLEFLTETIGGSISGTLEIAPGDISTPEAIFKRITIKDPFSFKGPSSGKIPIPGTPLALAVPPEFKLFVKDKKLEITADIVPADPSNVGAGVVTLKIKVDLAFAGKTRLPITGELLVAKQPIGKFEIEVANDGMSGSLIFPHPESNSRELKNVYNGVFSFKMDQKGLQAEGFATFLQIVKLNLDMFLSLDPDVDSFLIASQTLSIDGIQGKADFAARLTERMSKLHVAASVWVAVDLGVIRPEARIDITASCDDTAKLAALGALAFAEGFQIRASAIGITIGFTVPDIKDISLSKIEQELRRQLGDMFDRLSATAANYEKEKRELFAKWERHWSETITNNAKKYGIDAIRTGNEQLDGFLGDLSTGAKNAGHAASRLSKGVGREATNARKQAGKAWTDTRDAIGSVIGGGFGANDKIAPDGRMFVAFQNGEGNRKPFQQVEDTWREWISLERAQGLSDLEPFRTAAQTKIEKPQYLTIFAEETKGLFNFIPGPNSQDPELLFGTKLADAILGNGVVAPTAEEIVYAKNIIAQLPLFLSSEGGVPGEPDAFTVLTQELEEFRIVRTRQGVDISGALILRQIGVSFDDIVVDQVPGGDVTIAVVAQIAATETMLPKNDEDNRLAAASNLVPLVLDFSYDQRLPGKYKVRIDIPDPDKLTEKQLDWILDNFAKLKPAEPSGNVPRPGEFQDPQVSFDYRTGTQKPVFDQGDSRVQKRQKLEELISKVFGTNMNSIAAFDVNGIVRVAIQSIITRTIGPVEFIGSTGFTEKVIAIQNTTPAPVTIHVKARQRNVIAGEYRWNWTPASPGVQGSFTYVIPANTIKPLVLKYDRSDTFDDFGRNSPHLSGSRLRLFAESSTGERWDFDQEDIFTVDLNEPLGGDRVYQSQDIEQFTFVIQSRYVQAPTQVTLFKNSKAIVRHSGNVPREFKIPIGSSDVEQILETLVVAPQGGDPYGNDSQPWDWEATVSSDVLHTLGDLHAKRERHYSRSVDVKLFPAGKMPLTIPGQITPTFPVDVSYEHSSQPWKAAYQLHLASADAPAHLKSSMRGFYLFENTTGIDWKSTGLVLADTDGRKRNELAGLSLPRQSARLKPQDRLPLNVEVEPYLVYHASEKCGFPRRELVIRNKSDDSTKAPSSIAAGRLLVMQPGKPAKPFVIPDVDPNESVTIPYPGTSDDRVCITKLHSENSKNDFEGLCLEGTCLEYVVFSRQLQFEANFPTEYSSREAVPLLIKVPEVVGWQAVDSEVQLGNQFPLQTFSIRQYRDATWKKSVIDLCYAPLDELDNLKLHENDVYRELVSTVADLRRKHQGQRAKQLLCTPDLVIDEILSDCCVVHEGTVIRRKVRVRNLGGGHALFKEGDVILRSAGFEDILADTDVSFPPCCTREYTIISTGLASGNVKEYEVTVDPDSRVREWDDTNNSSKFKVP